MSAQQNRLAHETSPYLQQHADNPVAWYPWGEEALGKARDEDKPILLSVGYSACHWCHVMAHESFEDAGVAEVMNELFVNIKVDREERPDLDKIYQTAQMLLNQRSGGWPLTMFLTPQDQVPFFGGTYFPKQPLHGMPPFVELLRHVAGFYQGKRAAIEDQNQSMVQALESIYARRPEVTTLGDEVLDAAKRQLEQEFDAKHGGFAKAPKFPPTAQLERLLRRWAATAKAGEADERALHMAVFTLERMAQGGLYDHLGGGFCRYSVDDKWMIPHFEKMLYDNGPLLGLCAQVATATASELLRQAAAETAAWTLREMHSPEGGYYSSLDADSEGEEGKYYVWDRAEVEALLAPDDYPLFARRFALDQAPNFEGKWHLYVARDMAALAAEAERPEADIATTLNRARRSLFEAREHRVRPARDEKILTSWNALMIKGMALAARHLDQPAYADSAERARAFIESTLWRDGRLLATYKDGKAHLNAYLDDYAFLMDALLELLQVRWRSRDLRLACELAEVLLAHFEDTEQGGFYFTSDEHEALVQRPKTLADESTPSGAGIAAQVLGRLGYLTGETRYLRAVERTLKQASGMIKEMPVAHASLLTALEEHLHPPQTIVLRGQGEALETWRRACAREYAPRRLTFAIPADAEALPPALADKRAQGEVVAYVCEGLTCSAPITERAALEAALAETPAVSSS